MCDCTHPAICPHGNPDNDIDPVTADNEEYEEECERWAAYDEAFELAADGLRPNPIARSLNRAEIDEEAA